MGGHFHQKKAPAASWIAATGLVNPWVAILGGTLGGYFGGYSGGVLWGSIAGLLTLA